MRITIDEGVGERRSGGVDEVGIDEVTGSFHAERRGEASVPGVLGVGQQEPSERCCLAKQGPNLGVEAHDVGVVLAGARHAAKERTGPLGGCTGVDTPRTGQS